MTAIGLLYTDVREEQPMQATDSNVDLDVKQYEALQSFIVSCCVQGARDAWKKFQNENPAEHAFITKYGVTSLDTYIAKVTVGIDDIKTALSSKPRALVKMRIVCYCSSFGISCTFRVSNKLLERITMSKIDTADVKDFINACSLNNLSRHLVSKHSGKYYFLKSSLFSGTIHPCLCHTNFPFSFLEVALNLLANCFCLFRYSKYDISQ